MKIKLHHLRDLMAIVDHGSMSAAAKHLRLSQPAISRSVRELERVVGAPLLERSAKGALLTPMGELFVRRARVSVAELQRAQDEIAQCLGADQGIVTACISSMAHVSFFPAALAEFRGRYPGIRLRVIEGGYPVHERQILDGTIDFYVGPRPDGEIAPGLQQELLIHNTRCVLARKGHPLAKAKSLRELVGESWVTTSVTGQPEAEFNEVFARYGLPAPRLALLSQSALTWIMAVATSDLLALTARQFADAPPIRPLMQRLEIRESLAGIDVVHIQKAAFPLTPAAQHFSDLFRKAATKRSLAQ
jgi:molybdate transport repressor ModE-like protein